MSEGECDQAHRSSRLSEAQRQACNDWYDHTLYRRLNDKRHGAIVIIMQHLNEDDLVGRILAQGVKDKDLFLLGVFRRRLEYPVLKRAVREHQMLFGATVVLIEDKASGTQLIQELITDG
jgi:hypothetical protein